jgi:hypothetical protein
MFALKVTINEEPTVTAGAEDLGVLNAIVGCGGKLGSETHPYRENEATYFNFQLGGLTRRAPGISNQHVRWLQRWDLKVGDRVTIEIVEAVRADSIVSSSPAESPTPKDENRPNSMSPTIK